MVLSYTRVWWYVKMRMKDTEFDVEEHHLLLGDRIEIHFSSRVQIYECARSPAKSIASKKLHQSRGCKFLHSRIVAWHRDNEANAMPFFWTRLSALGIVLRLRIVSRTFHCNNNKKCALKPATSRSKAWQSVKTYTYCESHACITIASDQGHLLILI